MSYFLPIPSTAAKGRIEGRGGWGGGPGQQATSRRLGVAETRLGKPAETSAQCCFIRSFQAGAPGGKQGGHRGRPYVVTRPGAPTCQGAPLRSSAAACLQWGHDRGGDESKPPNPSGLVKGVAEVACHSTWSQTDREQPGAKSQSCWLCGSRQVSQVLNFLPYEKGNNSNTSWGCWEHPTR